MCATAAQKWIEVQAALRGFPNYMVVRRRAHGVDRLGRDVGRETADGGNAARQAGRVPDCSSFALCASQSFLLHLRPTPSARIILSRVRSETARRNGVFSASRSLVRLTLIAPQPAALLTPAIMRHLSHGSNRHRLALRCQHIELRNDLLRLVMLPRPLGPPDCLRHTSGWTNSLGWITLIAP
jgi:hypothetical protein